MYAWMGGQRRQASVNRNGRGGQQRAFFQRQRVQHRTARVRRSGGGGQAGPSGHADVGGLDEFVPGRERDRQKGKKRRKRNREPERPTGNGLMGDLVRFGANDILDFDEATANLNAPEKKQRRKTKNPRRKPKEETKRDSINRTFEIDAESNHVQVFENDVETSAQRNHSALFGAAAADNRTPLLHPDDRDGRRDRKRRRSGGRSRNEQELEISPSGRHTAHVSQRADGAEDFARSQELSHRTVNVSERVGEEEFAPPRKLSRRTANVSERGAKEDFPPHHQGHHRTANVSERIVNEDFAPPKMSRHRTENVPKHVGEEAASSPKKERYRTRIVLKRAEDIDEFAESHRRKLRTPNAIEVAEPPRGRRRRSGHARDPRLYSYGEPANVLKRSRDSDVGIDANEDVDAAVEEILEIRRPKSVRRKAKAPVGWPNKDTTGKGRMLFAEFNPAIIAREIRMFEPDRSTGVFQYPPSKFRKNRLVSSPRNMARLSPKNPKSPPQRKKSPHSNNIVVNVKNGSGNPFAPAEKSTAVSIVGNNNEIVPAIEPLAKELTEISINAASPRVSSK